MSNEEIRRQYGCTCSQCRERYHTAQRNRDPYYREPETSDGQREADAYTSCSRDPYARDPNDDGAAGW